MVVKELRQGLRTRAFGSTMLLMHALLILITLMTGSAQNTDDTRWMLDGLATLVLCFILPIRVSNALTEEVKMNTLDMLMLTRLSCSRIVFGKWASVALQALLIASSLMPYIVARYVFGGMDMKQELLMLGLKWLVGIVFAAVLVMLSTIKQAWLRIIIMIGPLIFGFGAIGILFVGSSSGRGLFLGTATMTPWWLLTLLSILASIWMIYACLSTAASRISAQAAPLALPKRAVHVLTNLILLVCYLVLRDPAWLAAATAVLCFLTLDVMTEQLNEVPSAYVPFFKRGFLGRLLMPLLAPGWASGFLLTLILSALLTGVTAMRSGLDETPHYVLICCTVWMMTAIIQILPFTRKADDLLPIFFGTFALAYLLLGMFSGLGVMWASLSHAQPWILAALPPTAMVGATQMPAGPEREEFLRLAMLCGAVWPLLMFFLAERAWRKLRPVRAQAETMAR